jgi:Asp-tRNA(Asn)/Glu-tRNA(Gln) amidotransferase A subunit family amidase
MRAFIDAVLSRIDVLVTPTIPEPAPALADARPSASAAVVARKGRFSRLTRRFNARSACPRWDVGRRAPARARPRRPALR